MRVADYNFVFDGWQPQGVEVIRTGYCLAMHFGLSYVQFHAVTNLETVSVRCDPCSLDQDQGAYAAMVRMDLEHEIAKAKAKAKVIS